MSIIKTEHLTYTYSAGTPFQKTAVDDVSLEIEEGVFAGVIGHTGSGKSTLIQHFNGLVKPTSGHVFIGGQNVWGSGVSIRDIRFQVGLVFQYPEYQLFEETVFKDIAFGPHNMGLSDDEVAERVCEAAAFVDLKPHHMEKSPFELSGGQKRRVAIAGVLAMRPKILILDEPTAGLDPKGRERILSQITEYHKRTGSTVLLVSHSMEDVAKYTQKVLVMNEARVFLYDDVERVFAHAEEISKMGLGVPQITKVFMRLKERGWPVAGNVYTVQRAKEELLRVIREEGGHA